MTFRKSLDKCRQIEKRVINTCLELERISATVQATDNTILT